MPDTPPAISGNRTRAQTTVTRMREQLRVLGIPEVEIRNIIPTSDLGDHGYVRMGTMSLESVELIITRLSECTTGRVS
jgi:hypothetical protein